MNFSKLLIAAIIAAPLLLSQCTDKDPVTPKSNPAPDSTKSGNNNPTVPGVNTIPSVDLKLNSYIGFTTVAAGSYLLFSGDGFSTTAGTNMINLVKTSNMQETSVDNSRIIVLETTLLGFVIPKDIDPGQYKVKLKVGSKSVTSTETFTITLPKASISDVSSTIVGWGETLTVKGENFTKNSVTVALIKAGFSTPIASFTGYTIVNDSIIIMTIPGPAIIEKGNYVLRLTQQDGQNTFFAGTITVTLPADYPSITSLDKFSYTKGETITINGANLKKSGQVTKLYFEAFIGSASPFTKEIAVNENGTIATYDIPTDFPTGTYSISIVIGSVTSESYDNVVSIAP